MNRVLKRIGQIVLHTAVLLVIFVGSILFFERMINQVAPDEASTMAKATFPLVYMTRNDVDFNCMHGYVDELDVSTVRNTVTPLQDDRSIGIRIQKFGSSVDSVSYEVLSLDGSESLENTKVVKLKDQDDSLSATLSLQDKMLMNNEYVLKICLTCGGRNIYYYTHVILADGLHTDDYLDFVTGFYGKTVNKTNLDTVGAAVEPDETTDEERTLAYMDIHDSVNQLTWSSPNPQIYYKPTPSIRQINNNTATFTMEYRISANNSNGQTEIYDISESYRVRFTDSRVFLLNFDRYTDEVFDPDNGVLDTKGIVLGITGKNVNYKADEKTRVIAWVQENVLWTYEKSTGRMTRVFGFPQTEDMSYRDFYDGNDIRILKVNSNGDVYFAVAGYMNRGDHEGENGVAVYYYEASTNVTEEMTFLKSAVGTELLIRDAQGLTYLNSDRSRFYVLLDDKLYKIDLNANTAEAIAEGIHENCHAVSASGRNFAYLKEGSEYGSSTLVQMDLETGKVLEYNAGEGEKIRPVAFMNEDLVYGLARDNDIVMSTVVTGPFPMYRMVIADSEGNAIKEYQEDGVYITDTVSSDNMLQLNRVTKDAAGTGYIATTADQIVSTDANSSVALGVATQDTTRKQNIVLLRVGGSISDTEPDAVTGRIISYDSHTQVDIPVSTQRENLYTVYAGGSITGRYSNANEAVTKANALLGYVVQSDQNYLWIRGDRTVKAEIQLEKVPEEMKNGTTDINAIGQSLGKTMVNLSGCTLDEVLNFVSKGQPVLAISADGPVTIVGYDEYNTYLLDPGADEWYYYGINDSTERFENAGNIFYTYAE